MCTVKNNVSYPPVNPFEHFAQWSYHISFPELATAPLKHLKKVFEKTSIESFGHVIKHFIDRVSKVIMFSCISIVKNDGHAPEYSPRGGFGFPRWLELKYHNTGREKDCLPQVGQWNMMNKPIVTPVSSRPDQVEKDPKTRYHDAKNKLRGREPDLLIVILLDNNGSLYGDLKCICETILD
ncbi:hypothetical protein ACSQ67_025414 [Phaseolus vulgaris]